MPVVRAALLTLLLIGCAPTQPPERPTVLYPPYSDPAVPECPVWVDHRFSPPVRAEIGRAVERWARVLGRNMRPYVASTNFSEPGGAPVLDYERLWRPQYGITIDLAFDGDPIPQWHPGYVAWTDRIGAHAVHVIEDRTGPYTMEDVVLHELGHVFGAAHTGPKDPVTLMTGDLVDEVNCVDEITARQVATWNGWDPASLAPECQSRPRR